MNKAAVLKDIIESRRSIFPKNYTGAKVPDEIVEEILNSANFAPNHKKTRPWKFIAFKETEKENFGKKLADVYKNTTNPEVFLKKKHASITTKVAVADTVVAVCVRFSGLVPEWEEIAATSMAVQNMYLTATAHEIGCYWSTPSLKDYMGDFLRLEEHEKCFGFFYIGNIAV